MELIVERILEDDDSGMELLVQLTWLLWSLSQVWHAPMPAFIQITDSSPPTFIPCFPFLAWSRSSHLHPGPAIRHCLGMRVHCFDARACARPRRHTTIQPPHMHMLSAAKPALTRNAHTFARLAQASGGRTKQVALASRFGAVLAGARGTETDATREQACLEQQGHASLEQALAALLEHGGLLFKQGRLWSNA